MVVALAFGRQVPRPDAAPSGWSGAGAQQVSHGDALEQRGDRTGRLRTNVVELAGVVRPDHVAERVARDLLHRAPAKHAGLAEHLREGLRARGHAGSER